MLFRSNGHCSLCYADIKLEDIFPVTEETVEEPPKEETKEPEPAEEDKPKAVAKPKAIAKPKAVKKPDAES